MHISKSLLGQIAGVMAFIQVIPYSFSIIKGKTRPARNSFLIAFILRLVMSLSYIAAGATTTIWTSLVFTFTAFLVFSLSIKRGLSGSQRLDYFCLSAALLGILLWLFSDDPLIALYLSTGVYIVSRIPIYKKIQKHPNTESEISWFLALFSVLLNLAALTDFSLKLSLLPLVEALTISLALVLIFKAKRTPTSTKS